VSYRCFISITVTYAERLAECAQISYSVFLLLLDKLLLLLDHLFLFSANKLAEVFHDFVARLRLGSRLFCCRSLCR